VSHPVPPGAQAVVNAVEEIQRIRNRVVLLVNRLNSADLRRLDRVLDALGETGLVYVARFAEGLADWEETAEEFEGAQEITPTARR